MTIIVSDLFSLYSYWKIFQIQFRCLFDKYMRIMKWHLHISHATSAAPAGQYLVASLRAYVSHVHILTCTETVPFHEPSTLPQPSCLDKAWPYVHVSSLVSIKGFTNHPHHWLMGKSKLHYNTFITFNYKEFCSIIVIED